MAKNQKHTLKFPYKIASEYKTKVAYFCMEYAINPALRIYSGGLGFLAGSHVRSAYELKQNFIGIGILWKYGYYDQDFNEDGSMRVSFRDRDYNFLEDTNIELTVRVHNNYDVKVKVWYLPPHVFNTAPLYFLSTDHPDNDYLAQKITHRLYDADERTRIAQSIVLGVAGGKLVQELGGVDIYHINEGHALPLAFYLKNNVFDSWEDLKKQFVMTTHTPEKAGNESHDAQLLNEMGFFENTLSNKELMEVTRGEHILDYTLTSLRIAKIANGVSELHGEVSRQMWQGYDDICEITHITNAQNEAYWGHDEKLNASCDGNRNKALLARKKEMKTEFFKDIASQTGKIFDPEVLTIVWARRFAPYKRADLLLQDFERFTKLISNTEMPIQFIWLGRPYPFHKEAIEQMNHIQRITRQFPNTALLMGYDIRLSRASKYAADVWLNTPRRPREASGTSGMTAAMNAAINVSTFDGWICEFVEHGKNGFIVEPVDETLPKEEQDSLDRQHFFELLENEVIPLYYNKPNEWAKVVKQSMKQVREYFNSNRMVREYYEKLYDYKLS